MSVSQKYSITKDLTLRISVLTLWFTVTEIQIFRHEILFKHEQCIDTSPSAIKPRSRDITNSRYLRLGRSYIHRLLIMEKSDTAIGAEEVADSATSRLDFRDTQGIV